MIQVLQKIPALVAAACIGVYWGAVVVKLVRLARKIGKDPNAMPREWVGQLMRVLWYPTVLVMLTQAWSTALGLEKAWERIVPGIGAWIEPVVPLGLPWGIVAALAGVVAVAGTVYTFVCWRRMGRSWRIGIDPREKLDLVCTGPYRYVRHPIYALRMVIDGCAVLMIPTVLMALTVGVDILLMQIEARREERYMEATHGQVYAQYRKNVGRFVPRISARVK